MIQWAPSLPVFNPFCFCHFLSFCEPLSFLFAFIYFFLLAFKDVSLSNHHPKHQLSTCISIGFFQGLPSHIFSIYIIVRLISDFPCFPVYFVSHSPCGLFFMGPCLFLFLHCGFIIQIVTNLNYCIISGMFCIKNGI